MSGLTLDAGALIGIERGSNRVRGILAEQRGADRIRVPAPVLAQVWRNDPRQAELHRFLANVQAEVVPFGDTAARAAGGLLAAARSADVVDASVVICAWARNDVVVTSDPEDLRRLDPTLRLVAL